MQIMALYTRLIRLNSHKLNGEVKNVSEIDGSPISITKQDLEIITTYLKNQ